MRNKIIRYSLQFPLKANDVPTASSEKVASGQSRTPGQHSDSKRLNDRSLCSGWPFLTYELTRKGIFLCAFITWWLVFPCRVFISIIFLPIPFLYVVFYSVILVVFLLFFEIEKTFLEIEIFVYLNAMSVWICFNTRATCVSIQIRRHMTNACFPFLCVFVLFSRNTYVEALFPRIPDYI